MPCPLALSAVGVGSNMLGAIPPTRLAVVGAVIPGGGPPCMHDYLFASTSSFGSSSSCPDGGRERVPRFFSSRGLCAARDAVEPRHCAPNAPTGISLGSQVPDSRVGRTPARLWGSRHPERSPALFSSRGLCAARDAVEGSLLDVKWASVPDLRAECGSRVPKE